MYLCLIKLKTNQCSCTSFTSSKIYYSCVQLQPRKKPDKNELNKTQVEKTFQSQKTKTNDYHDHLCLLLSTLISKVCFETHGIRVVDNCSQRALPLITICLLVLATLELTVYKNRMYCLIILLINSYRLIKKNPLKAVVKDI